MVDQICQRSEDEARKRDANNLDFECAGQSPSKKHDHTASPNRCLLKQQKEDRVQKPQHWQRMINSKDERIAKLKNKLLGKDATITEMRKQVSQLSQQHESAMTQISKLNEEHEKEMAKQHESAMAQICKLNEEHEKEMAKQRESAKAQIANLNKQHEKEMEKANSRVKRTRVEFASAKVKLTGKFKEQVDEADARAKAAGREQLKSKREMNKAVRKCKLSGQELEFQQQLSSRAQTEIKARDMEIDLLNGEADELEQKLHSQERELTKLREMEKRVKIVMEKSYKGPKGGKYTYPPFVDKMIMENLMRFVPPNSMARTIAAHGQYLNPYFKCKDMPSKSYIKVR